MRPVTARVVGARERRNCYDFAQFILERLAAAGIETELINFYDYKITPCQNCHYECVQKFDPEEAATTYSQHIWQSSSNRRNSHKSQMERDNSD